MRDTHIKGVAVEQLPRAAHSNVGQHDEVARRQLLLDGAALHKPHLPHLACRVEAAGVVSGGLKCACIVQMR